MFGSNSSFASFLWFVVNTVLTVFLVFKCGYALLNFVFALNKAAEMALSGFQKEGEIMKEFLDRHLGEFATFLAVYSWVLVFTIELTRI